MARPVSPEDLLHGTRAAAGTRNVREAVRELALHALRGHWLTAAHIAMVVRTVGEGIASCEIPPTAPVRDTHRCAWAGLEDAVGQALHAVEIALGEVADGRVPLTCAGHARIVTDIAQMERALGEGWKYPKVVPAPLKARLASLDALLQRAADPRSPAADAFALDGSETLAFLASGVLLGLADDPHRALSVEAR